MNAKSMNTSIKVVCMHILTSFNHNTEESRENGTSKQENSLKIHFTVAEWTLSQQSLTKLAHFMQRVKTKYDIWIIHSWFQIFSVICLLIQIIYG